MNANICPKCSGSGYVGAFAHVKNGECFDCGGTGTLAAAIAAVTPKLGASGITGLKAARTVADAVLAGEAVPAGIATRAFETFEDLGPCRWSGSKDYDRRNALAVKVAS